MEKHEEVHEDTATPEGQRWRKGALRPHDSVEKREEVHEEGRQGVQGPQGPQGSAPAKKAAGTVDTATPEVKRRKPTHDKLTEQTKAITGLLRLLSSLHVFTEQFAADFADAQNWQYSYRHCVKAIEKLTMKDLAGDLQAFQPFTERAAEALSEGSDSGVQQGWHHGQTIEFFTNLMKQERFEAAQAALLTAGSDFASANKREYILQNHMESIQKLTKHVAGEIRALQTARWQAAKDLSASVLSVIEADEATFRSSPGPSTDYQWWQLAKEQAARDAASANDRLREMADTFVSGLQQAAELDLVNEQYESASSRNLKMAFAEIAANRAARAAGATVAAE